MTNRIRINLVVFAIIAVITITWSAVTLFSFDRIERPYTVTAQFDSTPGLAPGFEVAYLGYAVGTISSVRLGDGFSEVELKIGRDVEIPAAIDAAARRKSAIGEPYVDLFPTEGADPDEGDRLEGGDVIPLERTTGPISYAELFKAVDGLVDVIDAEQVETIIGELADALDGRGDDLRTIIVSGKELTTRTAANADVIDRFIDDLASITGTLAANDDSFNRSVSSLTELTETLDQSQGSIDAILTETPGALALLTRILEQNAGSLLCTLDGLSALDDVADAPTLAGLNSTIDNAAALNAVIAAATETGYLNLTMQLAPANNAPRYPSPLPPPVAPVVPKCGGFTTPLNEVPAAGRAPLGPGGSGTAAADDKIVAPPPGDAASDAGLIGSSDLGRPDEPFLARALRIAIPLVALAALAALIALTVRRLRQSRLPAGPAPRVDDD